jgi:outer membrane lipoprotein-sorting protein
MTRLQTLIAWSAVSTALLTSANAQTVDDIINKYTDAIGGKAVLAGIQSMQVEGTANAMGNDYPLRVTIANGKAFKSEIDANGSAIVQCVTDTGGWSLNPFAGTSSPQMLSADQAKTARSSIYIGGPLVDYKSKGFSAELLGRVDENGVSAYRIRLFDNAGYDVTYDLDPNTYLILESAAKAKVNGVDVTQTSTYSNYQKTPIGYTMAYTIAGSDLGYDINLTYSKVEFNQDIDPQTFAVPK